MTATDGLALTGVLAALYLVGTAAVGLWRVLTRPRTLADTAADVGARARRRGR